MDFTLSKKDRALSEKAREFTEQHLIPYEIECEENNGLSPESHKAITEQVMAWGFNATNHSKEHGGAGFTLFEQMLASEQFGKVTGAIWDAVPQPSFPMKFGTKEQIEEYLIPANQCREIGRASCRERV